MIGEVGFVIQCCGYVFHNVTQFSLKKKNMGRFDLEDMIITSHGAIKFLDQHHRKDGHR